MVGKWENLMGIITTTSFIRFDSLAIIVTRNGKKPHVDWNWPQEMLS